MNKIVSIVLVLVTSVSLSASSLSLSGSDILAPIIEKSVIDIAKKSGYEVKTNMKGTYLAIPDLLAGKTDIAIIANPRTKKLPEELIALPFAYQAAVVVVNSVNPIEEISTRQLIDIYSANTKQRSENWTQVGVDDVSLRNIVAVCTSFSDNLVVELFKFEALGGTNLGSWVNMLSKKSDVLSLIKTNNASIGIVGKADAGDMLKVLPVSKSDGSKAYAYKPDSESIFNGDYPLTLPFYIVFKKENIVKIKPLLKILLDDKIATLLDNSDFYSAPKNSRKKSIFELDIIK